MEAPELSPEAIAAARSYAEAILSEPLDHLSGIVSEAVGDWRLRNQVRLILKTKELLEKRGVEPTRVSPAIFVPLVENAGNVDNETLSDMFAALLVSHLDEQNQETVHPSYLHILTQLSPTDASLLTTLRKGASDPQYRAVGLLGRGMTVEQIAETLECSDRAAFIRLINLERLSLIQPMGSKPPPDHPVPSIFEESQKHQEYRITEYGIAFCNSVTP